VSQGARTVLAVPTQRLNQERLERELDKLDDPRVPPVPVTVWLLLDGAEWDGLLHGWAANPNGADDGLRGLVVAVREFAPGFWAESAHWVRSENIRQRDG
jgi:hypothetical protein